MRGKILASLGILGSVIAPSLIVLWLPKLLGVLLFVVVQGILGIVLALLFVLPLVNGGAIPLGLTPLQAL